MSSEKEQFDSFIQNEFALLINGEYNTVINDVNDMINKYSDRIKDGLEKNKLLFSNYREIVLYCEVTGNNNNEALDLDYVSLFAVIGDAYFHREMFEEAKNAFFKAITMSPSNIVLLQRYFNTLLSLKEYDELERIIFKTFKYCYTKEMLIEQYLILIALFKYKKDYKTVVYILYLLGAAFNMHEYAGQEIKKLEQEVEINFSVPSFGIVLDYLKEKEIINPLDLSSYYLSISEELANNSEYKGCLDFLISSNSLFYVKKNAKRIKKLEKMIKKQKK